MKAREVADAVAVKLQKALHGVFDSVAAERRELVPKGATKEIIASYAFKNAGIAAACNVVPGPLGLVAAVPELVLITRNQVRMIADLGVSLGKGPQMNGRVLLAVLMAALGGGALSFAAIQGGKLVVKAPTVQAIQKAIAWLGGEISKRVVRQVLAKWFPIIGAAAMAYWAKKSTEAVGKAALKLLQKEISEHVL